MVALRLFLVFLPLAAAAPSSYALEPQDLTLHRLVRRHCEKPNNCGAAVQGTECNFCCAKDVKPSSVHCKAEADKACQADGKEGVTFNCDAD